MQVDIDVNRHFGGVSRLYSSESLAKLQAMHICIINLASVTH
ncbi:MAG: hypothetical protein WBP13_02535 [Methylophilaceae bacterium]